MCGILSIVSLNGNCTGKQLAKATSIIRHRGPDDEGLLTWSPGELPTIWAGEDTHDDTRDFWNYRALEPDKKYTVGFGHRRLSILDLSPSGHQPMIHKKAGLAITYNGEVYNYLEIKAELEQAGHTFGSTSDTEVILHAWEQWGPACLEKFNGMFAFVLLDYNRNGLYAVRDRFGVKPLYYYRDSNAIYFSSEIKQIRTAPGYEFKLNEQVAKQYLATGAADHTDSTFETEVFHVPCGHYLYIDLLENKQVLQKKKWYDLKPAPWKNNYQEAAERLRTLLTDAVRLRLRSDVTVGSCLSGGLDSSSIVCIAADLLKTKGNFAGQETVTACFEEERYDEWKYAQEVIKKTSAHPHRVFPDFEQLKNELQTFLWHQDEPVGSTSVYSQWSVFKATHEAGLKVMIDGQGADEQLAGYSSNDLPLYAGLLGKMKFGSMIDEARNYKSETGNWPSGFILGALQLRLGKAMTGMLPGRWRLKTGAIDWLRPAEAGSIYSTPAKSLKENLLRQVYGDPLPALLRYEDHNSMAWSVESRTPFMDYRLPEFTLGLPERFVYKRRVRKALLRDAMKGILPESIASRKDKMGFVTPEETWLKGEGRDWFLEGVNETFNLLPGLFEESRLRTFATDMVAGRIPFDFSVWRIVCLGKWYAMMTKNTRKN